MSDTAFLTIDLLLMFLVAITAFAVVSMRRLFSATILLGVYGLLMALVWVNMSAMDVAFTEAAVGAGISTLLFLGALAHTGTRSEPAARKLQWPGLIMVTVTGALLIYGTQDMPAFGAADAPVHTHLAPEYILEDVGKGPDKEHARHAEHGDFGHHVPNLVTAVLADYRSYDTMFETAVIFVAGVCLILLLRRPEDEEESA